MRYSSDCQGCLMSGHWWSMVEGGKLIGLAMDGPANLDDLTQTGAVYTLYVCMCYQRRG
jgi:hypothetical protein